jgi:hypothetical protein
MGKYHATWTCDRCGATTEHAGEAPPNWRSFDDVMPHRTAGWAAHQVLCPRCVAALEYWMREFR